MAGAGIGTPVKREAMYSAGAQKRIMLIHDTTQELPASALRRVLHVFSLNPGDQLSLYGVFQLESKLKRLASIDGKNSGWLLNLYYKFLINFITMTPCPHYSKKIPFAVDRFSVDTDALKKKEYENSWEIMQLSKLCETQKVRFQESIDRVELKHYITSELSSSV